MLERDGVTIVRSVLLQAFGLVGAALLGITLLVEHTFLLSDLDLKETRIMSDNCIWVSNYVLGCRLKTLVGAGKVLSIDGTFVIQG